MAAPRSPHAPLREGPPVPLFRAFDDGVCRGEDDPDEERAAKRVAARFAMAMTVIPFRIAAPKLDASDILVALRGHGVAVDKVRIRPGSWPAQVDLVGIRGGVIAVCGVVAIDLHVDDRGAALHAEIRIQSED